MAETYKASGIEARILDGGEVVVLIGKDDQGREVEVAIPARGLKAVYADAEKRIAAMRAQAGRQTAGDYMTTVASPGAPCRVGQMSTTEGERVVLTVHPGQPSETPLWYTPADAAALGQELLDTAKRLEDEASKRPKPN